MVAHHRVHDRHGAGASEVPDKVRHNTDLPFTAEKSAVHGLKIKAQGLPVGGGPGQLIGHVQKGEALKSAGVGGEKRGGQGTALNTHGGQDGDGDGQGAPAEAGQVVDGGDAGRGHGKNLVSGMGMSWIVIFILLRKMLLFKSG